MGAWVGWPCHWVAFRCEGRVEPSWNNDEQELDVDMSKGVVCEHRIRWRKTVTRVCAVGSPMWTGGAGGKAAFITSFSTGGLCVEDMIRGDLLIP